MATAVGHHTHAVHVHETPHELRVEIALPHGKPQFLVAATNRGLEIRVFRPLESVLPWHSNPDAMPT
jgi:hypothetical protein